VLFKIRGKKRGENLDQKVEMFRRWWQDQTQDVSLDRSNSSKENRAKRKPFDSSFVYYEEV
jgi:hypothetical protein